MGTGYNIPLAADMHPAERDYVLRVFARGGANGVQRTGNQNTIGWNVFYSTGGEDPAKDLKVKRSDKITFKHPFFSSESWDGGDDQALMNIKGRRIDNGNSDQPVNNNDCNSNNQCLNGTTRNSLVGKLISTPSPSDAGTSPFAIGTLMNETFFFLKPEAI